MKICILSNKKKAKKPAKNPSKLLKFGQEYFSTTGKLKKAKKKSKKTKYIILF